MTPFHPSSAGAETSSHVERLTKAPESLLSEATAAEFAFFRGRVALYAILKGLGIGEGDEVVIQGFTCVAVPEGVLATGATPVYADIEPGGYNLDPQDLRNKLTKRTRAIVVQHTFGIPAQMTEIARIAEEAGVPFVEDCCHAVASTYSGQLTGSFGVASFYSFEWGKPLVAGLGGAAIINDLRLKPEVARLCESMRRPSLAKRLQLELQAVAFDVLHRPAWYWPVRSAFHRLSTLGALAGNFHTDDEPLGTSPEFGLAMAPASRRRFRRKAASLPRIVSHSQGIAQQYDTLIIAADRQPMASSSIRTVYARYPVRVKCKATLLQRAKEQRIELADWYRTVVHPLEKDDLERVGYTPGACPEAERRAEEIVSLPTHRRVGTSYVERVSKLFKQAEVVT